jgi:kumamolisin
MTASAKQVPLQGATKHRPKNAEVVGEAPSGEFNVTVMVRHKQPLPPISQHAKLKPHERNYLSREQQADTYGADPADIAKVEAFARDNNLRVVRSDPAQRNVVLAGTADLFQKAFGVQLKTYRTPEYTYRGREGDIYIPQELSGIVTSITGLDNRQFAKPHFRIRRGAAQAMAAPNAVGANPHVAQIPAGFSPIQLADLYNFPKSQDGTGQTIGILELGGGFRQNELNTYFTNLGIKPPKVSVASFPNGGTNSPGTNALDPQNPDVEVLLDIEVAGSIAPGAHIVVYFAPDASDQSFLDVMNAMVHDATNRPDIISISWGGPEDETTDQFRNDFDQLLQSAAQMGITVCAAAGDSGSADFAANDKNWDHHAHVDFPASSPNILACGGTQITASKTAISNEVVWHDGPNDGTGGGVSRKFPQPAYQQNIDHQAAVNPAGPVMRGVPDVAGDAAPDSGYQILCDGQRFPDPSKSLPPVGGTSAVAPLWAGLVARMNQALPKPAGFINALLYEVPASAAAFHNITQGNNGDYKAGKGWNACTGLGSPNGQNLLKALQA